MPDEIFECLVPAACGLWMRPESRPSIRRSEVAWRPAAETDGSLIQIINMAGISPDRWMNAVVAGGLLLDSWGVRAAELSWHSEDLFAPGLGLVWLLASLDGAVVTAIDSTGAYVITRTGDRRRYQRQWKQ
jgi:hypothetical protein